MFPTNALTTNVKDVRSYWLPSERPYYLEVKVMSLGHLYI